MKLSGYEHEVVINFNADESKAQLGHLQELQNKT